jgi:CubicO group peptidase (beta-lactamase class C family)
MSTLAIQGTVDPRFEGVRTELERNFSDRGEVGAAVHAVVRGEPVIDLWGGLADSERGVPWHEDTLVMVHSATKGATALCAHMLAARGELDLDAPVARYWPEFAAAGKERVSVRMLLNHRAGLPAITRKLPPEAMFDWKTMADALAAQAPHWEPGTRHGYHALTYGWLVGEVVRRISGKSLGTFFRDEIAGPLGLDLWIGLPAALESRVAKLVPPPPASAADPFGAALLEHGSLTRQAFLNPPTMFLPGGPELERARRAAEIPAANGMSTARALAGLYAPLAASEPGLVDRGTRQRMSAVESEGPDEILVYRTRFVSGFMKSTDNGRHNSVRLGPNDEAFGHVGAGGSIGFADPVAGVAFGYVMNKMGPGILLNDRGQSLIDAL